MKKKIKHGVDRRHRWQFKMKLKEMMSEDVEMVYLAQDKVQLQAVGKAATKVRVS
jgi:hypothetical protein